MNKVSIILLNYQAPFDTIECMKSLLVQEYEPFRLIVADNGSRDGSLDVISSFLRGELEPLAEDGRHVARVPRRSLGPVPHLILDEEDIPDCVDPSVDVALIRNRSNTGFGGGNNRGIRYALACNDSEYLWLVNNDTVVDRHALAALVRKGSAMTGAGLVGSSICYYGSPETLQALGGGRYFPLFGRSVLNGKNSPVGEADAFQAQTGINYVMGASLLVRAEVFARIGLFDEDYFLYGEEVDLAERARNKGYSIGVAADSLVFHKVSRTTKGKKGPLFWFHMTRSSVLFLAKHRPCWMLWFYALTGVVLNVVQSRMVSCARHSLIGLVDGLKRVARQC